MLAGEGRRGHLRRALRRLKAVPRTLRNDGDHSSTERERLRPVLAHDFQCRSAVEDVNINRSPVKRSASPQTALNLKRSPTSPTRSAIAGCIWQCARREWTRRPTDCLDANAAGGRSNLSWGRSKSGRATSVGRGPRDHRHPAPPRRGPGRQG